MCAFVSEPQEHLIKKKFSREKSLGVLRPQEDVFAKKKNSVTKKCPKAFRPYRLVLIFFQCLQNLLRLSCKPRIHETIYILY